MIWAINDIDATFRAAFVDAGPIDEIAVQAAIARNPRRGSLQPQRHKGIQRYYYLLNEDCRVSLACIGSPLAEWPHGGAMLLVGTQIGIGEFSGNKVVQGRKTLRLTMKPLTWVQGQPDRSFTSGVQALEEISYQVLDLARVEHSQRRVRSLYDWRDKR